MEPASTTSIKLARAGLAGIFTWNIVRAATQAVTPGEAWNYDRYIGPSWAEALKQYDSNNHVLNTLLVRISTARIHLTEFSMRLPSLLCGGLYLWAVYRLARRCFGEGAMFLAVMGLLVLNPLVMDAMSEARGYGMAMAAWMWALELILESLESFSTTKFNLAGVMLGLSVAGSLSFAAPAAALILAAIAYRRGALAHLPHLTLLTVFVLLAVPLNHAEKEVVTVGAANLRQTLNQLTAESFGTSNLILNVLLRIGAALLTAAGLALAVRVWRRRERNKGSVLVCLMGGTLVLTVFLLMAANRIAKAAFPESGAIYAIPILTLLAAAMAARPRRESVKMAFLALAALCVAVYASQIGLPYRAARPYTGSRELAKILRQDAFPRRVRVGVSDDAEGIVRYYRWRYRQGNWEPIERVRSDAAFEYYVLTPRDGGVVQNRGLHVMYRDEGLILAKQQAF